MKLSQKIQAMELSPIRKFVPYADAARAAGKKVYGLNIGQPDIKTPRAFFDAVKNFDQEVLAYANSQGEKSLIEALIGYYKRIGIEFENKDILITNGGSEALSMIFTPLVMVGAGSNCTTAGLTVSALGIRLNALSMENGRTSRSATMPQSRTFIHLGERFDTRRSTSTASTSQLAEMLRFKSFKKTAAMVSLLSAAVDHALNFRNVLLRKRFPRGKSRQKRGKGTVEGVLHKFLALYGVIALL